jgi:hypothetical protein
MKCPERERRWQAYNEALVAFSRAVDELGTSAREAGFEQSLRRSQQANDACKRARACWEEHIQKHKCSE